MYGKKSMGIIRSTVLIGTDGRIAKTWPKVSVKGHAEAVVAAVAELGGKKAPATKAKAKQPAAKKPTAKQPAAKKPAAKQPGRAARQGGGRQEAALTLARQQAMEADRELALHQVHAEHLCPDHCG